MNKKAVLSTLVFLIVFVVGAIILLGVSYVIANQVKEDADIETCRLSVLAQSQLRKLPFVPDSPKTLISLDCPRRNIKIYEDKVTVNGKKSRKYDFSKLSKDEVNHILAEEMRFCWYKMAEGNQDVFENNFIFGLPHNVCLICSEISFDDKSIGNTYVGLVEYLKSRKISNADISYFDYLIKYQPYPWWGVVPWSQGFTPWGYSKTGKIAEDVVNSNNKYSIYFLAYKPNWLDQFTKIYNKAYFVGLGKDDKIENECDELVN